jgi:hypothetical protein
MVTLKFTFFWCWGMNLTGVFLYSSHLSTGFSLC